MYEPQMNQNQQQQLFQGQQQFPPQYQQYQPYPPVKSEQFNQPYQYQQQTPMEHQQYYQQPQQQYYQQQPTQISQHQPEEDKKPQDTIKQEDQAKPAPRPYKLKLKFEELGVYRRAALNLLPNVSDPEIQDVMSFSSYKSSRKYKFLNSEKTSVTLEGGYRLCRSTRFLQTDRNYYWEFDFTSQKNNESHLRLGIATIKADMEAPVGVDQYGYCIADLGKSLHNSRKKIKTPPFHVSDTIGFGFIPGHDSISLRLFINGVDHGIIFDDISMKEKWMPAVSVYREAVVTARYFRPFKYDPGNNWAAAGDISPGAIDEPILAKDLVKAMKGQMSIPPENNLYMSAIYAALTPAHQMPI